MKNKNALTTTGINLRLDNEILAKIQQAADLYGVTAQDLIRLWIAERINLKVPLKEEKP